MNETTRSPWQVERNDVIIRHPDHPNITGEWRVIGDPIIANGMTTIPYSMPDGGEGVFVLQPAQRVTIRTAATYRVHALFTRAERDEAMQVVTEDELRYITATVCQRYPEIFDHALLLLGSEKQHQAERRPA